MAHGQNAAYKANKHKEFGSRRLPGYQPKNKIAKKLTHRKERATNKKVVTDS